MKHTKSIIASVLLVGVVATTSVFAATSMGTTSMTSEMHKNHLSNPDIVKILQDKGITVPTPEEAQAFHTKMQSLRSAEKNLSDADKASFKLLRESFKKQERDFLRSKGVTLPSEEEVAKMELIRTTLGWGKDAMRPGSGGIYSDHKMMEGKGEKMHQKGKMKERKNKMMRGSGSTTSPMTPPVAPIQTN